MTRPPSFDGPNTATAWPFWRVWLTRRPVPDDWSLYDLLDANEAIDILEDLKEWRRLNPSE